MRSYMAKFGITYFTTNSYLHITSYDDHEMGRLEMLMTGLQQLML